MKGRMKMSFPIFLEKVAFVSSVELISHEFAIKKSSFSFLLVLKGDTSIFNVSFLINFNLAIELSLLAHYSLVLLTSYSHQS